MWLQENHTNLAELALPHEVGLPAAPRDLMLLLHC